MQFDSLSTEPSVPSALKLAHFEFPELVHLDDPAFSVLLDFTRYDPPITRSHVSMDDALSEIKLIGSHLLLVVDDAHQVIGILSSEDLLGEKPIQLMHDHGHLRSSITVGQLMNPLKHIRAVDFQTVGRARVGNIVHTLQDHDRNYLLVIQKGEQVSLRGLFNLSQIRYQLHRPVGANRYHAPPICKLAHHLSPIH